MFQYCLGRILAEELGYALQAEPLPGFVNTNTTVVGEIHAAPVQVLAGHKIDLGAILSDRSQRHICLTGWFQRQEYYAPYRQQIREWLAFDGTEVVQEMDADLVLNVRRTDYIGLGWALPYEYYAEAIGRVLPEGGKISIVTDDIHDPFFHRFRKWKPRFFQGTPLQQMSYMSRAPRLVMSASTFSWWPAFLGDHETVVCPVPDFGVWQTVGGDNINLIDQERFICIDCQEPYQMSLIENLYQRFRSYRHVGTKWINKTLGVNLPVQNY